MNRDYQIVACHALVATPTVSYAASLDEAIDWARWYTDRNYSTARVYKIDSQEVLFDADQVRRKPVESAVAPLKRSTSQAG